MWKWTLWIENCKIVLKVILRCSFLLLCSRGGIKHLLRVHRRPHSKHIALSTHQNHTHYDLPRPKGNMHFLFASLTENATPAHPVLQGENRGGFQTHASSSPSRLIKSALFIALKSCLVVPTATSWTSGLPTSVRGSFQPHQKEFPKGVVRRHDVALSYSWSVDLC